MNQQTRKRSRRKVGPLKGSQASRLRKGAEEIVKELGFSPNIKNILLWEGIQKEVEKKYMNGEISWEEMRPMVIGLMQKEVSRSNSSHP